MGQLVAPNGMDITNDSSIVTVGNISDPGFISLQLQNISNEGVYSCVIPDQDGIEQYLHIGIYYGRFNSM